MEGLDEATGGQDVAVQPKKFHPEGKWGCCGRVELTSLWDDGSMIFEEISLEESV